MLCSSLGTFDNLQNKKSGSLHLLDLVWFVVGFTKVQYLFETFFAKLNVPIIRSKLNSTVIHTLIVITVRLDHDISTHTNQDHAKHTVPLNMIWIYLINNKLTLYFCYLYWIYKINDNILCMGRLLHKLYIICVYMHVWIFIIVIVNEYNISDISGLHKLNESPY